MYVNGTAGIEEITAPPVATTGFVLPSPGGQPPPGPVAPVANTAPVHTSNGDIYGRDHREARTWAFNVLLNRPVLAVDGSQIAPTKDIWPPVAAVRKSTSSR